jgi:thiosulfate/3-mercaptopyruvate sulfurtransferase
MVRWAFIIAVLLPVLSGCVAPGRGQAPGMVPPATVGPFPGNDTAVPLLVDPTWLTSHRGEPELLILDLSSIATYRRGHVPGAVHVWWRDTMDRFNDVYGVLPSEQRDPETRRGLLATLGVGGGSNVVVYDDTRGRQAGRIVWMLRYLGVSQASMLDGGLAAWRGNGGDIETAAHTGAPVTSVALDPQDGYLIGTGELQRRLTDRSLILLDVRTPAEAADDANGTVPLGRIPGSVSVPWTAALRDEAGRLRPPTELLALYRAAGVVPDRDKRVIIYARFGVEAGSTWLVLKLLGYPFVRVYDAGWAGWVSHPELPRADPPTDS